MESLAEQVENILKNAAIPSEFKIGHVSVEVRQQRQDDRPLFRGHPYYVDDSPKRSIEDAVKSIVFHLGQPVYRETSRRPNFTSCPNCGSPASLSFSASGGGHFSRHITREFRCSCGYCYKSEEQEVSSPLVARNDDRGYDGGESSMAFTASEAFPFTLEL